MKQIYIFFFLLLPCFAFSQSRIVLNNDGYIVIRNSAYLVVANGNANAITTAGTGGRIITEAENNRVRWNISNNTGTYTIPYYDDDNAQEIPFSVAITSAGSAGGRIDFSTYDNASWNNSTYQPSDVTNMNSFVGGANNSAKVIDRFWIADATSYGTRPTATLSFTYIDGEWNAAGNTITEGNLGAQRFDSGNGDWDAYTPQGTVATGANTVTAVPVATADFFRSWTLVDNTSPLPIELLSFSGSCVSGNVALKWSTASETNNAFFSIEKSADGITFETLATVNGAGNSSSVINYSYTDYSSPVAGSYYRLRQTDFNGSTKNSPFIFVPACADPDADINVYNEGPNTFTVAVHAATAGNYTIRIYNALGQILTTKSIYIAEGYTKTSIQLENIDKAMYFVNISNGSDNPVTKKIVIN